MILVDAVKSGLRSHGYVASNLIATQVSLLIVQQGVRSMILDGPPGSGKTFLAKSIAKLMGVNYIYTQAHPGSLPEDFLFDINLPRVLRAASGGKSIEDDHEVYELGFLPEVFQLSQKGPVVAFVDELDKADSRVDSLFLSALQEGEVFVKNKRYTCNQNNLILFFTKNKERELTEPLMRRCRREFLTFPEPNLEIEILCGLQVDREEQVIFPKQHSPKAIPKELARFMISAANRLRSIENFIKAPASSELFMACQDVLQLVWWGKTESIQDVILSWLAGYESDQTIAKGTLNMKELTENCLRIGRSYKQRYRSSSNEFNLDDDGDDVYINIEQR